MPVRKACLLASVAMVLGGTAASAQNVNPATDGLSYRVEIGRHEQLVKVRASAGVKISPFKSDGCSGGQSAGWVLFARTFPELAKHHGNLPPWQYCCVAHDRAYHAGGGRQADARASYADRLRADEQLRQCVIRTGERRAPVLMAEYGLSRKQLATLYRSIADVMYRAVRLGGVPCTGLPWRWGFGWPRCNRK